MTTALCKRGGRTPMKKFALLLAVFATILVGCGKTEVKPEQSTVKVGMVTDITGIDDKSFSEITWKGVSEFADEHEEVEAQYLTPKDNTLPTLVSAVDNLVLSGNEVIVLTGFVFEETAGAVAKMYPNVKFVLIDGQPLVDGEYKSYDNVVSIYFNEHESAFLTGVASALETETGKLGFIGGIANEAVKKFGWGYVAGVAYANQTYNTNAHVVDYVYSGSFSDVSMGQSLAGGMFDKGIDTIMHAAGGVGVGAMTEAKTRGDVKIVGVDVDQYHEGLLNDGSSIILTSAMKNIDVAVKEHLGYYLNDEFKGGQVFTLGITDNGVGIPSENPNLSDDTIAKVEETMKQVKDGAVAVPSSLEDLHWFLNDYGYSVDGVAY